MKTDKKNEYAALELLADEYSRAILSLTSRKEYSAIHLSRELDMPIATVYRKLKLMENAGLISHVKTMINQCGNEEKYFECVVREINVHLNGEKVTINFNKKDYRKRGVILWKRPEYSDIDDADNNK